MNCNVLFPWFPIKKNTKHNETPCAKTNKTKKTRIILLVVLMRENLFWHHYLMFPTNPKRKAAVSWAWAPTRADSTLRCSPQVCPQHPDSRRSDFRITSLSFPGSPERRWTLGRGIKRGNSLQMADLDLGVAEV